MKRYRRALLGAVSVIALAVTATAAPAAMDGITPQEKALIEPAKKEGAVVFINPLFQESTAAAMQKAFTKYYGLGDGFKFQNLRKGTGATVAQVTQEIKAGKFTVDVHLVNAPAFFDEAAKRGAGLELDSGQWKYTEPFVKRAGQYSNYPYVVSPLGYAFQPVWNNACPGMEGFSASSYQDVLDPKLKGKTIASDITKSFTYTNTVIALQRAGAVDIDDMWKKLKAIDPIVEFRSEPKMQMLVSCERAVDMWNRSGRAYQNILKEPSLKGKLGWGTYKEGEVMLGNQLAVLKGGPHPNAGKLLVEFLMSKAGADIYVEGEILYSFREGYVPPESVQPYMFDLTKTKVIGMDDWLSAQREFKPVREKWQSYFQ
jgi:ABC-type Fe3+ transport system substrate-binding protein